MQSCGWRGYSAVIMCEYGLISVGILLTGFAADIRWQWQVTAAVLNGEVVVGGEFDFECAVVEFSFYGEVVLTQFAILIKQDDACIVLCPFARFKHGLPVCAFASLNKFDLQRFKFSSVRSSLFASIQAACHNFGIIAYHGVAWG